MPGEIQQHALRNDSMTVKVINFGAAITDIIVPDREGNLRNVVLGFEALDDYKIPGNPYLGSTIGRYANRISNAGFTLNGKNYRLVANNNGNTLHGGTNGFHTVMWDIQLLSVNSLRMQHVSPDRTGGFPGNLRVEVLVTLNNDNSLTLEYSASTDQPTPVNLTNHSYFNLSGGEAPTILDHELTIHATRLTTVDAYLIPTGGIENIEGGPFDFTNSKPIRQDLDKIAIGYDHNYVLNKNYNDRARVAMLYDPHSGRQMELITTEPGLQFYSGHFFNGEPMGKGNQRFMKYAGLCLEPQHFPDSPNQPDFPNTILEPGQTYRQTTIYKFSVR